VFSLGFELSTSTAAPPYKYGGMLRVASNPSAAVQSPDGLFLYYFANNRYYHNHHQMMVEFICLNFGFILYLHPMSSLKIIENA
jgi:hypothetical protein